MSAEAGMNYRTLHVEHGGGSVATVWLNRPGQRNALNAAMLEDLTAAFAGLAEVAALRVVVVAARGPVFCAGIEPDNGLDIEPGIEPNAAASQSLIEAFSRALNVIHACPVPVLARVQGDCLGAGMALAAACDIVLAAGPAGFSISEPQLSPHSVLAWVAKIISTGAARRYLLTGERFSAFEGKQIGFVHEVMAAEALDERLQALISTLLQADQQEVAERRRLLRQLDSIV